MTRAISRKCIILDFETDGLNPETCNPVQLASITIDLKRLEIIEGSEFNAIIRPPDIDDVDYYQKHKSTIDFHCENKKQTVEEILNTWRGGYSTKDAFIQYNNYVTKQAGSIEPIVGGQNIRSFDLPILDRYLKQFNIPNKFYKREQYDLLDFCSHWFLYAKKPPANYKLDTLLAKFEIDPEGAHDALVDVKNTGNILIRFLGLHKRLIEKIPTLNG